MTGRPNSSFSLNLFVIYKLNCSHNFIIISRPKQAKDCMKFFALLNITPIFKLIFFKNRRALPKNQCYFLFLKSHFLLNTVRQFMAW